MGKKRKNKGSVGENPMPLFSPITASDDGIEEYPMLDHKEENTKQEQSPPFPFPFSVLLIIMFCLLLLRLLFH